MKDIQYPHIPQEAENLQYSFTLRWQHAGYFLARARDILHLRGNCQVIIGDKEFYIVKVDLAHTSFNGLSVSIEGQSEAPNLMCRARFNVHGDSFMLLRDIDDQSGSGRVWLEKIHTEINVLVVRELEKKRLNSTKELCLMEVPLEQAAKIKEVLSNPSEGLIVEESLRDMEFERVVTVDVKIEPQKSIPNLVSTECKNIKAGDTFWYQRKRYICQKNYMHSRSAYAKMNAVVYNEDGSLYSDKFYTSKTFSLETLVALEVVTMTQKVEKARVLAREMQTVLEEIKNLEMSKERGQDSINTDIGRMRIDAIMGVLESQLKKCKTALFAALAEMGMDK